MKRLSVILAVFFGLLLSFDGKAQVKPDYFPGKWKVTVFGTPQGDAVMLFVLERKDGKLTGAVRDSADKEISRITQVDEKDSTITAYFTAQSYDVNLTLQPVDSVNTKGNLMGMFDAKGVRVKETKQPAVVK